MDCYVPPARFEKPKKFGQNKATPSMMGPARGKGSILDNFPRKKVTPPVLTRTQESQGLTSNYAPTPRDQENMLPTESTCGVCLSELVEGIIVAVIGCTAPAKPHTFHGLISLDIG